MCDDIHSETMSHTLLSCSVAKQCHQCTYHLVCVTLVCLFLQMSSSEEGYQSLTSTGAEWNTEAALKRKRNIILVTVLVLCVGTILAVCAAFAGSSQTGDANGHQDAKVCMTFDILVLTMIMSVTLSRLQEILSLNQPQQAILWMKKGTGKGRLDVRKEIFLHTIPDQSLLS